MATPFIDVNRTAKTIDAINQYKFKDNGSTIFSEVDPQQEIPLPDVWIPFNNSLIMREGYGDELRANGITFAHRVSFTRASSATYIDKSGVLRTAGVDEPRFEKEGLLIEGQSTNLIADSETVVFTVKNGVTEVVVDTTTMPGFRLIKQVNDGSNFGDSPRVASGLSFAVGDVLTASAVFKMEDGVSPGRFRFRLGDSAYWREFSFYCDMRNEVVSGVTYTKTTPFSDKSLVKVTMTWVCDVAKTGVDIQLVTLQVAGTCHVGCFQFEKLPFASSYIPTSGAAATRAADLVKLEPVGNMPMNQMTLSCEWEAKNRWETGANARRHIISSGIATTGYYSCYVYKSTDTTTTRYSGIYSTSGDLVSTSDIDRDSGVIAMRYDGTKYAMTGTGAGITLGDRPQLPEPTNRTIWLGSANGSIRFINGHIRNFRIWHKALPDYHLKALTKV